ncbi:MAG: hypothetical protein IJR68_04775 [Fretibacterium sp.]|nr:hypothetical protein [Fretibacterium sp.]
MRRFLEYEAESGNILCELYSDSAPETGAGHGILEIDVNLSLDTNNCAVRDGRVVRLYETAEERRERERLRREHKERAQVRIRALIFEFMVALIEEDNSRMSELREEYAHLRSFL